MNASKKWDPQTDWNKAEIKWDKIEISKEDFKRFTKRSDAKALAQVFGFLLIFTVTGGVAWWAMSRQLWVLMALALYLHGSFYGYFGSAQHELGHGTVFKTKWLGGFFNVVFAFLNWSWNPALYRNSHNNYHHRYTLHQNSDGEETPTYIELSPKFVFEMFFNMVHPIALVQNLGRLFTLKPTSRVWRGRGYQLDSWEKFVIENASDAERRKVRNYAVFQLVSQLLFVAVCLATGCWFLVVLITLGSFYGAAWHAVYAASHQHLACEANDPDFRKSCNDVLLDPFSSLLYWHMEYHIAHHMFAAIPCYNLKAFSEYVSDQMPERGRALPRLLKLNTVCKEQYGSLQYWLENFGFYKGL